MPVPDFRRVIGRLRSPSRRDALSDLNAPMPVLTWSHVRDSLLLLAIEIAVDIGLRYAEQYLPISPVLLRQPRIFLRWFIVATVCWLCADPLIRLVMNSRQGISASSERLTSMKLDSETSSDEKSSI